MNLAQAITNIERDANRGADAQWVAAIAIVVLVLFVIGDRLWEARQERRRDESKAGSEQ